MNSGFFLCLDMGTTKADNGGNNFEPKKKRIEMEIDSVGVEDQPIVPTITDDVIASWTSALSFEKGYTLYSDNKPKTVLSNGQMLVSKFGN